MQPRRMLVTDAAAQPPRQSPVWLIMTLGITMRRYIIPFFLGFVLASVLFVFVVLPPYGREKVEFGRKNGEIITKLQLTERVRDKLGSDYRASDGYDTFFEVKADAVVVVERDGVKTLRNYVGGR